MKNIKLIEVPSEIGAGTRGASLGVEAIKIAALDFMSNFFIHFPSEKIPSENKLLYEPIESPYAKRIKGVVSIYDKVTKAVSDAMKNNFFPVVISGDHSTAGATIAGIKMAKPVNTPCTYAPVSIPIRPGVSSTSVRMVWPWTIMASCLTG